MADLNNTIIDKIKKLLNLANDKRANENEASLAMERVQVLLAQYNLTLSEVEASRKATSTNNEDAKRTKEDYTKSAMYDYQRQLMAAIAASHFCLYWVGEHREYTKRGWRPIRFHVLVGREANVITAKLMFEYLNTTIERLASEVYPHPRNLSKDAISWKHGCAFRLQIRLQEKRREMEVQQQEQATKKGGTGLMLLTDVRQSEFDLSWDFLHGDEPGTHTRNRLKWQREIEEGSNRNDVVPRDDPKPETEKERAARERREAKYRRDAEKLWYKTWGNRAFVDGHNKGGSINLDDQVGNGTKQGVIK